MTTNLEALKSLYAALGGTPSTVAGMTELDDVIGEIAKVVPSGGGSGLPEVTSDQAGYVLTVSAEGEWVAAAPAAAKAG